MEEEKKRQSTVQSEQTQGFNSHAEDEVSLKDLLTFIARKKKFILTITSVFTLCSIFYVQSIIPIYRATVSFLYPKEQFSKEINHEELSSFFSTLEQLDSQLLLKVYKEIRPKTIVERFLLNLKAHEFKQAVFVNGGFQNKFFRETGIDTDQSVSAIYNSTKVIQNNESASLELEGSKPKLMLEFLTALVEASKENVNTETKDIVRFFINTNVKTRINNLSTKIDELHQKITGQKQIENLQKQIENLQKQKEKEEKAIQKQKEKEEKAIQKQKEKEEKAMGIERRIAELSNNLAIAKNLGIKNNNLNIVHPDSNRVPIWFLYGELALQQEIMNLRKEKEISNTKNLAIEKHKLKSYKQKIMSLESKEKEISNTKNLAIDKLKLKGFQQEIISLRSKKEGIYKVKKLSVEKAKLKRFQTAYLPLLKFKVVTIGKHSYSLVKPNQPWLIVGFGVVLGLFISIFMAFLIDLKNS